jgi:hypothetical protein
VSSESQQPKGYLRWVIPVALTIAGFAVGFFSWALRSSDPWWSSALVNVAVVLLFLVPGEFALRWLRRSVTKIERAANAAVETANEAKTQAGETARTLEDVRATLLSKQSADHEAEQDIYRRIVTDPTRASLIRALAHATETDVITEAGVRSPIRETDLHYRFMIGQNHDQLTVNVEQADGTVLSVHLWADDQSPEAFYQTLVDAVGEAGADLGVGLNDPTYSVQELSIMLVDAGELRAQELMGHRDDIRKIIERVDGWYFTERHVIPADSLSYTIRIEQLKDAMWEDHLTARGWYRAAVLIPFARKLYDVQVVGS